MTFNPSSTIFFYGFGFLKHFNFQFNYDNVAGWHFTPPIKFPYGFGLHDQKNCILDKPTQMLEYCWTLCSFQFSFLGKIGFGGNIYWQSRHTKQLFWKCFTFAIYGIHKEENKTNIALPGAEFKILPKYCTIQGWLY